MSSDFNISYADGSGAAGDYVTDTLTIGGTTIKDFQFGIGFSSGSPGEWFVSDITPNCHRADMKACEQRVYWV